MVPYLLPSKNSIPSICVKTEIPLASQKKVDSQLRVGTSSVPVTLAYSGEEDGNEDGGGVDRLFSSLAILSKYISIGYTRLGPAIINTVNMLYRLDAITEEQYRSLTDVFQPFV